MHTTVRSFIERVQDRYGFEPEVVEFEETTKTAAAAADAIGCDTNQIASSIVMVVDNSAKRTLDEHMVVAITDGTRRVDEGKLGDVLGTDPNTLRTASPDEIKEALGWSIGGVPPFGYDTDVRTVLDERMLEHDRVWGGAGTPKSMIAVSPERIQNTTAAEVADITAD